MFLTRIVLENVRSIAHLELPLTDAEGDVRGWTFLLGENGTGKTTLLRSVALVLAGSSALPEILGEPSDWVRRGASAARIRVELTTAEGLERTAELVIHPGDSIRHVYERNAGTLEQLDAALAHTMRSYFTAGYGASRHAAAPDDAGIGKSTSAFRSPRARSVATLFSAQSALTSLEAWAMDLEYRRGEAGLAIARDAVRELLPGIELASIDRERRELLFDTPDGRIPHRLLSEGYQNVAAWTGDLLNQITEVFEDFHDPFSARGLLLVDEIDLHLHPTWQRRLMQFVRTRFPNFQVIATTHSPLTVHEAAEGELWFLRRETPEAPATLHAYGGAPRDLMLHQLITSPVFGLTTLDSRPVEAWKKEYRRLRDKDTRNEAEERRLEELRSVLEDLPDWSDGIAGQAELKSLMREIKSQLRDG